jgi:hypothetical protein
VLGPCGVIPKEFSNINCFNIDLPANRPIDQLSSEVLGAILSEFSNKSRGRIVGVAESSLIANDECNA